MKPFLLVSARILISASFLLAGILKWRDAESALIAVYQYQILSWQASGVLAAVLPFLEITTAIGLWIPRLRLGASTLSVLLYLLFIAALTSAVARNLDVSCGCFGTTDLHATAFRRLLEDAVLLGFGLLLTTDAVSEARSRLQSSP